MVDAHDRNVQRALEWALEGHELSFEEALPLATCVGPDLWSMAMVADTLRRRQVGARVSYVVNRNVNFTNVCIKHCGFCAFSRDHRQEEGYFLGDAEIFRRVEEAVGLGATEVCVQAGLPPKMDGRLYIDLTAKIKGRFPGLHLHAFSPEEVLYGSIRSKLPVRTYLRELKAAGLDTMPGTSAEILHQPLRDQISPGRISVDQWTEVVSGAHEIGLRTTSTMMFGFLEEPEHWVLHLLHLRAIQKQTGGITEFVPLGFVHSEAPMYRRLSGVRPGPSGVESLRVHALARILLGDVVPNVQASWVKEGPRLAQLLLDAGCNDLGGTLLNESISTAAGSAHGQFQAPADLRRLILDSGREPYQRNTLYEPVSVPSSVKLDEIVDPRMFGSYHELVGSADFRFTHPSPSRGTS